MNGDAQKHLESIDQNLSYETLINKLKASVYEYPDSDQQINALDFFISNYEACQNGYHCTKSNKARPILFFLEKLHLVKKSKQFNFFYRSNFIFNLTQNGIEFYNNIPKNEFPAN